MGGLRFSQPVTSVKGSVCVCVFVRVCVAVSSMVTFHWAAATYQSSCRQIEDNNIWHWKRSLGLSRTKHSSTHCWRSTCKEAQRHAGECLTKPSESRMGLHEGTLLSDPLILYWGDGRGLPLLLFSLTPTTTTSFSERGLHVSLAPVLFTCYQKYCCSACKNSVSVCRQKKCL